MLYNIIEGHKKTKKEIKNYKNSKKYIAYIIVMIYNIIDGGRKTTPRKEN